MIPRIIHQIWYQGEDQIPSNLKDAVGSWKQLHPSWTRIFWDSDSMKDMIMADFPWFLDVYQGYEYDIQRIDAARYFFLYKYGGVYADADLLCRRPLDSILEKMDNVDRTLAFAENKSVDYDISNWLMISSQGNDLWPQVWTALMKSHKGCWFCWTKHFKVMYSTGPAMLNKVVKSSGVQYLKLSKGFNECNICNAQKCGKCSDCYVMNLNARMWNSWDSWILNKLYCNWEIILFMTFLLGFAAWYFFVYETQLTETPFLPYLDYVGRGGVADS